jgi:acetyl-CoA carboxylase biotin carboxyl carrier protein
MTGVVLDVVVGLGAQVQAGDELVIVESMKMEIPVECPAPGRVAEILVEPQQRVEEGDLLLRLEI